MELQKDIREFIALLLSENVNFVLVGGYALAVHGAPRFTEDIDFIVQTNSKNATNIIKVLTKFGFGDLGISEKDFLQPDHVIQLGMPPNRIDILTNIDGVNWEEVWDSRVPFSIDGLEIQVIGKETLLKNKLATGRTKDQADAERLQQ